MTTYTVPQVPGSRRTSPRPYTHAIIGRRDLARERANVASQAFRDQDFKNYDHHRRVVAAGIGGIWLPERGYIVDRQMFERSRAEISGCDTPEQFHAKLLDFRLTSINRAGTGPAGPLVVISWSMSLRNAEKAAEMHRRNWFVDVSVVPCIEAPRTARQRPYTTTAPTGAASS